MISRICICCGEPFSPEVNEAIDNPNICVACSQMTDDADELNFEPTDSAAKAVLDCGYSTATRGGP